MTSPWRCLPQPRAIPTWGTFIWTGLVSPGVHWGGKIPHLEWVGDQNAHGKENQSTLFFINIIWEKAAKIIGGLKVWLRSPHRSGERDEKVTCCDVPAGMEYRVETSAVKRIWPSNFLTKGMRRVLLSRKHSFDCDTVVFFCVIPKRTSKGPVESVDLVNCWIHRIHLVPKLWTSMITKGCHETRKLRVSKWIQHMTGGFRWIWKLSHLYFFGRSLEVVQSAMNMFDEIPIRYHELNGQSTSSCRYIIWFHFRIWMPLWKSYNWHFWYLLQQFYELHVVVEPFSFLNFYLLDALFCVKSSMEYMRSHTNHGPQWSQSWQNQQLFEMDCLDTMFSRLVWRSWISTLTNLWRSLVRAPMEIASEISTKAMHKVLWK